MTTLPTMTQLISLKGKHALITGSAAGIGRAIAHRFAEAGAALSLIDMNESQLAEVKEELAPYANGVDVYTVDLSHKDQIDNLWANLNGRVPDILVNNAGIYPFKHFLDVNENLYQKVMNTNLNSVYWMCQRFIERRVKQGGIIINLGSIEAVLPFKADLAHYSVSKAGVIALTRALAKEHAKDGIRVNAMLPGGILTEGTKTAAKMILKGKFDLIKTGFDFKQRLPIGRMGQPDEVARIALVLASDLATYVHGAAIPIDGGFLAA